MNPVPRRRAPVLTGGPDAVHLCLTVRGRPHPYGCAWASYGEARLGGPVSRGPRRSAQRVRRARRLRGAATPTSAASGDAGASPPPLGPD